ncbi:MAG: TetR/AcrR family transcriptional regulator [Thermoleophilaceae bacterium]|nr:TetR/AcrR family transcriptional regulator [Thermoleophilaceae bacterium]
MSEPARATTPALDTVRARPGGRSARIRELVLDAVREELASDGYAALSHRSVAKRAGVDPATVYRRWPTRPLLATDALLEIARNAVPIPDTGALAADLEALLDAIVAALSDTRLLRLFHALSAAGAEADADLGQTLRSFWDSRFKRAEEIVNRAVVRGELSADVDRRALVEQLVAPAYFRALVTGERFDAGFTARCVRHALAAVHG